MIIQCPKCQTAYDVDEKTFMQQTPSGQRQVRCHNCQNLWIYKAKPEAPQPETSPSVPPMPSDPLSPDSGGAALGEEGAPPQEGQKTGMPPIPQGKDPYAQAQDRSFQESSSPLAPQRPSVGPQNEQYVRPSGFFSIMNRFHIDTIILVSAIVLTGVVFYLERETLVNVFPVLEPVYDWMDEQIDRPVSYEGLAPEGISFSLKTNENGETLVVVWGEIENATEETKTIPKLRIEALAACSEVQAANLQVIPEAPNSNRCRVLAWSHSLNQKQLRPSERIAFQSHAPLSGQLGIQWVTVAFE